MASTLSQLVNRTLIRLSQVAGTGTQIYSEDRIAEMIQHKFDILFDLAWWEQFMTIGQVYALDGTLGEITTDVSESIKHINHIQAMWPENSDYQITKLPMTVNTDNLSGTTPAMYSGNSDASKVFTVWPKTATGNIVVNFATKPDAFTAEDTINFDEQALILGAAYDYAEDDGTNPAGTAKLKGMFDSRVSQLLDKQASVAVSLDPQNTVPTGFTFQELS